VGDPSTKWSTPDVFRDRNLAELVICAAAQCRAISQRAKLRDQAADRLLRGRARVAGGGRSQALRSASELKLLHLVETTLLATYLGSTAGQRVLAATSSVVSRDLEAH